MKYFAILKDSFREALDSKVLYVLLVLSTVVIGSVATISCKPLPAEKAMEQFFPGTGVPLTILLNVHKPEKMHAHLAKSQWNQLLENVRLNKVELLSGEADGPESEYALTISYQVWPFMNNDLEAATRAIRDIFQEAVDYDYLRVGNVESIESKKEGDPRQFRVTVQGTPRMLRIWPTELTLLGVIPLGLPSPSSSALGFQLYIIASLVLMFGEWAALLVGVIITSFFIPNMLHKGTVDLLLVKPIRRWLLLLSKYLGGLTFIFLNTAYGIVGIWLVLGIRTGLWANGMFLMILTVTFFFAILYAISTLVGVLTRSTVTSIMVTIAAWLVFFAVGTAHTTFENQHRVEQAREKQGNPVPEGQRWGDHGARQILNVLHAIMPRTTDLSKMDDMIIYTTFMTGDLDDIKKFDTSDRNWWESLLVSTIWIGIFLTLAALWFTMKDY